MEDSSIEKEQGNTEMPTYNKKKLWISTYQMEEGLQDEMAQLNKERIGENVADNTDVQNGNWVNVQEEQTDDGILYENIYEVLPEWRATCKTKNSNKHGLYENVYEVFNTDKRANSAPPTVGEMLLQLDELMESLTEVLDELKNTACEDSKIQTLEKGDGFMIRDTSDMEVDTRNFRYSLDETLVMNNYIADEETKKELEHLADNNLTDNKSSAEARSGLMANRPFLRKFSLRGPGVTSSQTDKESKEYSNICCGFEQLKTIIFDERNKESKNKGVMVLGLSSSTQDVKKKGNNEPAGLTARNNKTVDKPKTEPRNKAARVLGLQQLPYHANGTFMRVPATAPAEGSRHRSWFRQGKTKPVKRSKSHSR